MHTVLETDNSDKLFRIIAFCCQACKNAAIIRLAEDVTACILALCYLNVSFGDETDKDAYLEGKRMLKETVENGR